MVSDPIADMLTRIKNASLARHRTLSVPYSRIKEEIGKILVKEGYLKRMEKVQPKLNLTLKYENNQPLLNNFKRVSKPGIRVYKRIDKIPYPPGPGLTIVSTPQGLMTGSQARKKKIGGEIICHIW